MRYTSRARNRYSSAWVRTGSIQPMSSSSATVVGSTQVSSTSLVQAMNSEGMGRLLESFTLSVMAVPVSQSGWFSLGGSVWRFGSVPGREGGGLGQLFPEGALLG